MTNQPDDIPFIHIENPKRSYEALLSYCGDIPRKWNTRVNFHRPKYDIEPEFLATHLDIDTGRTAYVMSLRGRWFMHLMAKKLVPLG